MFTGLIRRICIFGGPGIGKSTLAARLFADLKVDGLSVELVTEYIKAWAYEKRPLLTTDQIYIFSKQQRMEDRVLRCGVKYIVTDSPLYMQCAYAKKMKMLGWEELIQLAHKFDSLYPSYNIFLDRKGVPYKDEGRYHNYQEAVKMDRYIKRFLNSINVDFEVVDNNADAIYNKISSVL